MSDKKILIIDIETTGFLQAGGSIVEIGIVELDLSNGERKIIFDQVCWETGITRAKVENSWIVANSSMTVEEIRQSKNLETYRPRIQAIFAAYRSGATAYNNAFDFGYLKDRGFTFPKELPCPMKLSTNVCKIEGKKGGYKWPKVQEAWDHFFGSTDYIETHRGADDAFHEAAIVYRLYQMGIFKITN